MLSADQIASLLAHRHSGDLFVEQCKNGPTFNTPKLVVLDGWALSRSWKKPKMTAYEIKISRNDFLRDDKWRDALPLCNEFYWVAPAGVIEPEEIAAECGLLRVSPGGTRLYVKKRAPYREIAFPEDLVRYVLMSRVRVQAEHSASTAADVWREWLNKSDEEKELGWNVSRKIRDLVKTRIQSVEAENKRLRQEIEKFIEASRVLRELNLIENLELRRGNVSTVAAAQWNMRRTIQDALRVLPSTIVRDLRTAADALEKVRM